jgi:glycosyltransferase involved in cell wall biosynthesis
MVINLVRCDTIVNMQKPLSVAVVIPAFNEEATIASCLESCFNQKTPFSEIIVVDNLSTDKTVEIITGLQKIHKNLKLVFQTGAQGILPTRNLGFNSVSADIIGRIDADTIIDENWVVSIQETFMDNHVAAASGPVEYHDMPLPKVGLAIDEKIRGTLHKLAKNHRFLFGTNMAIRKSAWRQIRDIELQDPDNTMHEDISLALALFQNDFEIVYAPTMLAGMSARRIENSPRDFYRYVMRFENTFRAYGLKSTSARIPIFIYLLIYFPVRTIRKFYDGENSKFTLAKLKDDISLMSDKIKRPRLRKDKVVIDESSEL